MAWADPLSANLRAARRLSVLGAGLAATAAPMPWQQWLTPCFMTWSFGNSWLDQPEGMLAAALAVAVLLLSGLGDTSARRLLQRARRRAWLAGAAAAIWGLPLPFGPALPEHPYGPIHWSWMHQWGAVGALTCAVGAWWWARALGQRLTDRAWRRFHQRGAARAWAQPSAAPQACVAGASA